MVSPHEVYKGVYLKGREDSSYIHCRSRQTKLGQKLSWFYTINSKVVTSPPASGTPTVLSSVLYLVVDSALQFEGHRWIESQSFKYGEA